MKELLTNSGYEIREQAVDQEGFRDPGDEKAARERAIARLRILWGHRGLLVRVTAWGFLLATGIAVLLPSRYESTAQLMPPDNQSNPSLAMLAALSARTNGLSALAGDVLGLKGSGALLVGVLGSRTVQDGLVERFDLKRVYGVDLLEDARKKLTKNTSVSEDRKSGVITITVTDYDPKRAAAIASAYINELDRLVAGLSTSAAHRERVFLEERLRTVKAELDQAAKQFSEFASRTTAIDIKEQGRAMVEAAAVLNGHLIAARTELEGLRQIYTENNVRVHAAEARIAELQRQLKKLEGTEVPTNPAASQGSDSAYPTIRQLPLLGVRYADLYRQTKIQEVVYEVLTQQYELAKVQEAKEIPSIKVLDEANTPQKKSFPPRLLIMFLGALLAFAFAAIWVLGRTRWTELDAGDPGKMFVREILSTVKTQTQGLSPNGSRFHMVLKALGRVGRRIQS